MSQADRAILRELEKHLTGDFAILHTGPVKNGEIIRSDYSLVIMGDVRTGGLVEATGSVYVLGSLYGDVVAGSDGNRSAIVMSGNLKPRSLSIGSLSGYHVPSRARKSRRDLSGTTGDHRYYRWETSSTDGSAESHQNTLLR